MSQFYACLCAPSAGKASRIGGLLCVTPCFPMGCTPFSMRAYASDVCDPPGFSSRFVPDDELYMSGGIRVGESPSPKAQFWPKSAPATCRLRSGASTKRLFLAMGCVLPVALHSIVSKAQFRPESGRATGNWGRSSGTTGLQQSTRDRLRPA
jgi:hypothetical protein